MKKIDGWYDFKIRKEINWEEVEGAADTLSPEEYAEYTDSLIIRQETDYNFNTRKEIIEMVHRALNVPKSHITITANENGFRATVKGQRFSGMIAYKA